MGKVGIGGKDVEWGGPDGGGRDNDRDDALPYQPKTCKL